MCDQLCGDDRVLPPITPLDGVAVLGEQRGDLLLDVGDAPVVVDDASGEIADASLRGLLDEAVRGR